MLNISTVVVGFVKTSKKATSYLRTTRGPSIKKNKKPPNRGTVKSGAMVTTEFSKHITQFRVALNPESYPGNTGNASRILAAPPSGSEDFYYYFPLETAVPERFWFHLGSDKELLNK